MIHSDLNCSKNDLVIAFPGLKGNLSLESPFWKEAGLENHDKVIIHDPSYCLLLGGLKGAFANFQELLLYIEKLSKNYFRVVITGMSGGGYTALLIGSLINVDRVVVFAPYTYIGRKELIKRGDPALNSMSKVLERLESLNPSTRRFFNLNQFYKNSQSQTNVCIHVSYFNKWDKKRADCLKVFSNVKIHYYPLRTHAVASKLGKVGVLKKCFTQNQSKISLIDSLKLWKLGLCEEISHIKRGFKRLIKSIKF